MIFRCCLFVLLYTLNHPTKITLTQISYSSPTHKFSVHTVLNNVVVSDKNVLIPLPLPVNPLKTEQWVTRFSELFSFTRSTPDWGADRYQVVLSSQQGDVQLQCVLCIEWLCEAIWLEPIGIQQSPQALIDYLMTAK